MTIQAKDTRRKLLAAGFTKNEFRIRTETFRRNDGTCQWNEYGLALVSMSCAIEKIIANESAILSQKLGIKYFLRNGEVSLALIVTDYEMQGKIETIDLDKIAEVFARYQAD